MKVGLAIRKPNSNAPNGRNEEANAVQEQGLLVDPLNPVLSAYIAGRLTELGEREREFAAMRSAPDD